MAKTRREFTPEFKREAVALLESSGRSQMQIVAEFGIYPSMPSIAGATARLGFMPFSVRRGEQPVAGGWNV